MSGWDQKYDLEGLQDMSNNTSPENLDMIAWGVIANVSEGDWSKQTPEWQEAATRWRDMFHESLRSAESTP